MKRRFTVLAIVVTLVIAGCATTQMIKGYLVEGVTTGVTVVDQEICPTVLTAKDAIEASAFLWPLINSNPALYTTWLVFDNFSSGVCYFASRLKKEIDILDQTALLVEPIVVQGQLIRQSYKGVPVKVGPAPRLTNLREAVGK